MKYSLRRRRGTRPRLPLGAAGLVVCALAQSQDTTGTAPNPLDRFIAEVDSLDARFVQELLDEDGAPIEFETATGRLQLLRPDRFRLHQESPDEVIIVSDGALVWSYEVDLEQVDCLPFDEFAAGPVMFLLGRDALGDDYRFTELAPVDGQSRLELRPVGESGSDFTSAIVTFDGPVPVRLEWIDLLGMESRVEFTDVAVNSDPDADNFVFRPPDGVRDVCEHN